jgi:hypothetical protein
MTQSLQKFLLITATDCIHQSTRRWRLHHQVFGLSQVGNFCIIAGVLKICIVQFWVTILLKIINTCGKLLLCVEREN